VSPVAPRRPGGGLASLPPPVVGLAAVAAVVVLFAALVATGLVNLPQFGAREPSTEGLVAVPTPAVTIPAYARIRRDHLWDQRNNRLSVVYLPPAAVTKEMLTSIAAIIGRVLDHDKEAGYVFTESDFLPIGTREGLVAGIPAGKRAIRISGDRVEGLFGLRAGDRFDLMATMPINASQGGRSFDFSGPYGQEVALQAQLSNWDKQATVRVIVQSAVIVEPMSARGVTTIQNSLTDGATARTRQVQEAVIAIDPEEVAPLTEAIAVQARLTTIPRSGRPDDPPDSRTPDRLPVSPFGGQGTDGSDYTVVETIMGQQRSLTAVPNH